MRYSEILLEFDREKRIAVLKDIVTRPTTSDAEKEAAKRALKNLLAKELEQKAREKEKAWKPEELDTKSAETIIRSRKPGEIVKGNAEKMAQTGQYRYKPFNMGQQKDLKS